MSLSKLVQHVQRGCLIQSRTQNERFVGFDDLPIGDHLVQYVVGLLDVEHYVQLALELLRSDTTFSKYLSRVSTRLWMNYRYAISF